MVWLSSDALGFRKVYVMIQISNLSKSFGDLQVLDQVSLEIKEGDIYGIIGQSGAGKSTLLRCINGLEGYNGGSLKVEGKEIADLDAKGLRLMQKEMGMIFQNFNLLSRLNVYDNVALPLQFWGQKKNTPENKARILDLLKLVGLEDKVDSFPSQLSGGQKQRVAIARALVLNPRILLCDEATSALDPQITKGILALLSKINKELGITIVVVTHQMEVVKEICNQMVLIEDGKVVAQGKPEELFVAPNSVVNKFLGESNEILPQTGKNIKLFFNNNNAEENVITGLARNLNLDFSICQGKLENFRGTTLGSLVINVNDGDEQAVIRYLDERNIQWERL